MRAVPQVLALLATSGTLLASVFANPITDPLSSRDASKISNSKAFGPQHSPKNYTWAEMTSNIKAQLPADRVIQSADLRNYLVKNFGQVNHTILVEDTGRLIDMSEVFIKSSANTTRRSSESLDKRQGEEDPCFGYTAYWVLDGGYSLWSSWFPASYCLYTGLDSSGGSEAISWTFSITYTETAGVTWNIISSLGLSFGFSIAESYGESSTYNCIIPGNSVGQIWYQNLAGYGYIDSEPCFSCDYGSYCDTSDVSYTGWFGAPADGTYSLGCSTGYSNVDCSGFYSGISFSVGDSSP